MASGGGYLPRPAFRSASAIAVLTGDGVDLGWEADRCGWDFCGWDCCGLPCC